MQRFVASPLLVLLLLLSACTPPAKNATASVVITSHADGAVITGSRNITVTADLTDAAAEADITATHNGDPVTPARSGDVVSVTIPLADHANSIVITVANPEQATAASDTVNLNYPFLTLTDGQEAKIVIGQTDFTTTGETARDKFFESLYGRPLLAGGILYLPDYGANRVLGYDGVPTSNGAAADFVLGQANFDERESTPAASVFRGPQTLVSDGDRLFVADYSIDRILVYNSLPAATGAAADHVIGQADFVSDDSACSATRFDSVESVSVADGKLIVADGGNNRVLIWNTVPTVVDTPADLVLGQGSMTTCEENDDDQDGIEDTTPTNRTMYWPADVWSDGERLIVADTGNNRVLIWNAFPTTSFAPADLVLGQADFTTDNGGTGPGSLDMPYMLHSNGNQLFVADSDNNRVLIWNEFPTDDGQAADVVLGQVDMTGNDRNAGGSVSGMGFEEPNGVYANGNQLFVADYYNDRYLVFEGANP